MLTEFDAAAANAQLAKAVADSAAAVRPLLPPAIPQPLFHADHQGNVVNRAGKVVVPKPEPLAIGTKQVPGGQ